nr:metal ABC transporter substrate-binding protein [Murinocardiopsis flavida]
MLAGSGCAGPSAAQVDGRPQVLTTFTVLADMTRAVAGDAVAVHSVIRPGAEIHEYEPSPDDLIRGLRSDLVLDNGLGLELWFAKFTERVEAPSATVSKGVRTIPIRAGSYRGKANPHAWMSPRNALIYVDNIRDALSGLAPGHADEFAANAAAYKKEIRAIDARLGDALGALPESKRALVTCEGAFSYLARDAGLDERYLWPVNAEGEPTPQQIASVVDFVRDNEVPAVFCESTVNDSAQRQVARETGAALGDKLYVDSLSGPDGPVPHYLDLLRYDTEAIIDGLTRTPGEGP